MSTGPGLRRLAGGVVLAVLVALAALSLWKTAGGDRLVVLSRRPAGIMGTTCQLVVVVPPVDRERGERALDAAEAELRRIEALMSTWIDASEVSRLNQAGAGEFVPLSADVALVLRAARDAFAATGGAFDVTCRPLIELWREAGRLGRLPDDRQIRRAREASRWDDFELRDGGAIKRRASARVDLGGIAKGYAIDRALEALRRAGASGGLVDVGGDLHVFGRTPRDAGFEVEIRHPRRAGAWRTIRLTGNRAICTSGDYARHVEIGGRWYGHVIDPRTGRPADVAASVSVIAGDAMTADAWATALTVTGSPGLDALPEGIEALLLAPDPADPGKVVARATAGFPGGRPPRLAPVPIELLPLNGEGKRGEKPLGRGDSNRPPEDGRRGRSARPPADGSWADRAADSSAGVRRGPRRAARYRLRGGAAVRIDGDGAPGRAFRPPLADPAGAVREALAQAGADVDRAIERLEYLRAAHAPDAHVLATLARLLKRRGQLARTVEVGREAIEACFRQRNGVLAGQLLVEIDADAHALGLDRDHLVALGASLARTDHWPVAFRALASCLMATPTDEVVARALLRLADRLLERTETIDDAWRVAEFLAVVCECPRLSPEIAERARRAEGAAPARRPTPPSR